MKLANVKNEFEMIDILWDKYAVGQWVVWNLIDGSSFACGFIGGIRWNWLHTCEIIRWESENAVLNFLQFLRENREVAIYSQEFSRLFFSSNCPVASHDH